MPEDRRVMAAVRNLGVLLLDPSLGFCETLVGMPALLGNRRAETSDDLEEWLQSHWTPLFHGDWLAKPVRGFFRRVSLQIDETEFEERTVSPEAQAWMIRALATCCRYWEHQTEGFWPGLQTAWREMAARLARFTTDHLRYEGQVTARRFDFFEDSNGDWEFPLPLYQGLWLDALCDLYRANERQDPGLLEEIRLWVGTQLSSLTGDFDRFLQASMPVIVKARLLQGMNAVQAIPSLYREELDHLTWLLHAHLLEQQWDDGSWEGNLSATAEVAASLSRMGSLVLSAACPEALGRSIAWLQAMHGLGRSFPAPMAGLRIWEYRLYDIAALLEAGRQLKQTPILHPEDREIVSKLYEKWWRFAMGRRVTIPKSQRYGGLWVAGIRYIRERKQWYRDLRLEPGSVGRLAYEALQANLVEPHELPVDGEPRQSLDA
jgi:hypothetical protein